MRISPDSEGEEMRVLASSGPCNRTSALVLSTRTNKDELGQLLININLHECKFQSSKRDMQFNAPFIGTFTPNLVPVLIGTQWQLKENGQDDVRKVHKVGPIVRPPAALAVPVALASPLSPAGVASPSTVAKRLPRHFTFGRSRVLTPVPPDQVWVFFRGFHTPSHREFTVCAAALRHCLPFFDKERTLVMLNQAKHRQKTSDIFFQAMIGGEVASAATKLKLWKFNEEAAALFGRCIIQAYEFDSKGEQFYCEGR
ncbi:hypothetical protein GEV33_012947 [Tenebrio molitor]|uniref:Uncharacterized protein n=1 Tax=Tenebrio molitor TaxID=7067 RepID=A0A8J6L320_TENMO|nr:hypothetical protein GEV33_012947 [Tenebrio molitor]